MPDIFFKTFNKNSSYYSENVVSQIGGNPWTLTTLVLAVVPSLSQVWLFETPWTAACQSSLSFTISRSLIRLMPIESVMPSNYLVLCCPLTYCLPSSPASGSFLISCLFTSGGQSIGASASGSVLPMTILISWQIGIVDITLLHLNSVFFFFPRSSLNFNDFSWISHSYLIHSLSPGICWLDISVLCLPLLLFGSPGQWLSNIRTTWSW